MRTLFTITSSLAGSCSPLLAAVKKRYSISEKRRLTALAVNRLLFQCIRRLVDAGLGADLILLAAGRSRDADRADHIVAGLDRQGALGGHHVAEMDKGRGRVVLDPLDELPRRHAKGARRICLAEGVLHGVRPGGVPADLQDYLTLSPADRHPPRIA